VVQRNDLFVGSLCNGMIAGTQLHLEFQNLWKFSESPLVTS
jgi:hypothetical protein